MRTDVKIGIVVGLLILGVVVVYFSLIKPADSTPGPTPPDNGKVTNNTGLPKGDKTAKNDADKKIAKTEKGEKADKKVEKKAPPVTPPVTSPLAGKDDEFIRPPFSSDSKGEVKIDPTPPAPLEERKETAKTPPPVTPPIASRDTPPPGGIEEFVTPPSFGPRRDVPPVPPPVTPPVVTPPVRDITPPVRDITPPVRDITPPTPPVVVPPFGTGTGTGTGNGEVREYVVQQGDNGYWAIAEKMYGPGKGSKWAEIAKANPNIESGTLRPGMKLKIPPLPTPAATPPRPGGSDNGGTIVPPPPGGAASTGDGAPSPTGPAGSTTYVVKDGDTLWVIAERVYGNGSLFPQIQKANPNVNTSALRVGARLVIPPKPGTATPPAGTGTTPGATTPGGPDTAGAVTPGPATRPAPRRTTPRPPVEDDDRPIFR